MYQAHRKGALNINQDVASYATVTSFIQIMKVLIIFYFSFLNIQKFWLLPIKIHLSYNFNFIASKFTEYWHLQRFDEGSLIFYLSMIYFYLTVISLKFAFDYEVKKFFPTIFSSIIYHTKKINENSPFPEDSCIYFILCSK